MLIPFLSAPYADYATALAVVTDPIQVADCIAYSTSANTTFAAAFSGTVFTASGTWLVPITEFSVYISISAKSGATIGMASSAGDAADWAIYKCDGTAVEGARDAPLPITSSPLPADGEYIIVFIPKDSTMIGFSAATATITSSNIFNVNPVIALWNDSGTTRSLWACPKLLLPLLTEHTGTWYASCADAHTVLIDPLQVSNCVGYLDTYTRPDLFGSFTATDGGSSLTFNSTAAMGGVLTNSGVFWGGINAVAGQTLSFAFTTDGGDAIWGVNIYDDTGTLVETLSGSPSMTSSPLPYTGRYTISGNASAGPPPFGSDFTTATLVVTSSGAMSVNPIQARYDAGLACAGLLNCGDACP